MQPTAANSESEPASDSEKPTLQEVIERIGFGPAHLRFCLTGGGVYLADGAELLLITAVTKAVADDWGLGGTQRAMAVTIVFIGVLIGNIICGPMGDMYGRRQLIIISYVGIFIFSVLSSFTAGYATFCMFRLFVGFSFGIGQPAWNALCTEVTPRYWRIPMNGLSQTLFVGGEIYSASLILADDPQLKQLHWRRLLQLGAIPSALFAVAAALFLLPSPSFLAIHGKNEAAKGVLDIMKKDNGVPSVSTAFQAVPPVRLSRSEFGYQLKKLFNRSYWSSTVITGLTCFGLNIVYYGCLYAFPQILPDLQGGGTAGLQLLVGALWEIPGNAAGILFGMCMPRKPVIKLYLVLMSISLMCFIFGVNMQHSAMSQVIYQGGYFGIKAVACIGYVVTYQYAGEIYPTEIRATGVAFCIGSGRLGAMIAPIVFETVQDKFGSYIGFFYILAAFCVLNCVLIDFLPYETSDMLLKDRLASSSDSDDTVAYGSVRDGRVGGPRPKATSASSRRGELDLEDSAAPAKPEGEEVNPDLDDGCTMPP